jgi:hypothetical protein
MVITIGLGPQEKAITPPFATASTTAAEVQPAGVPLPITVVGFELSAASAAAGIAAWPSEFPGAGSAATGGADDLASDGEAGLDVAATVMAGAMDMAPADRAAVLADVAAPPVEPHADESRTVAAAKPAITATVMLRR